MLTTKGSFNFFFSLYREGADALDELVPLDGLQRLCVLEVGATHVRQVAHLLHTQFLVH